MKKFILSGLLALAAFSFASAQAQYSRYSAKYYFFNLSAGDTMDIGKDSMKVAVTLWNPSYSTDSIYVTGDSITYDGFATSPWTIAPGDPPLGLGYDDLIRINKLRIVAGDKAKILLVPVKE